MVGQMTDLKTSPSRKKWIDAAKGIAILMVIMVHLSQCLPNLWRPAKVAASFGAMGVQLFFIMSAYSLCQTWRRPKSYASYLIRKYRRLLPWYCVGIIVYALYWFVKGGDELENFTPGNIVANVLLINALIPSAQNSIVPGGWSISCIALFAFAYPAVAESDVRRKLQVLFGFGLVGVVVSAVGYCFFRWDRFFTYCSPLNQGVIFAVGVAFWHLKPTILRGRGRICAIISIACFLLAACAVIFDREHAILYRQILMAVSFALVLPSLERVENLVPRPLLWLGRHSYEIFILHFAGIWLLLK